jgi:hypothetical protein
MIGSLLYVIASRPNVKQVVGMVARFQEAPKEIHVQVVKRIFRYLKGTIDLGLWYPSKDSFTVKSYSDAYWAGCVDDRKKYKWRSILFWRIIGSLDKQETILNFFV